MEDIGLEAVLDDVGKSDSSTQGKHSPSEVV